MKNKVRRLLVVAMVASVVAACASQSERQPMAGAKQPDAAKLTAALAGAERPAEDKARDADRKPGELLAFFGVQPGMTAVDVIAIGGYLTEVLAIAVGPQGKVYMHNPPVVLQMNDGAYAKAIAQRVANDRLPNVVRLDADLPASAQVPPGSVDVAISAMNYHDARHISPEVSLGLMKGVFAMLKPGGVFGVTDHVGNEGADNKALHRVPKRYLIEDAQAAGFIVEAESDLLANPADDHTQVVFNPALRGKTDQFTVRLRKPK